MDSNFDNLKRFIDNIKNISFWDRLFTWGKIKSQLVDASADLQKLISNSEALRESVARSETQILGLNKDLQFKNDRISGITNRKNELDIELAEIKKDLQNIQAELSEVKTQNTRLIKNEEYRKQEHSNHLASLTKIQDQIQAERNKEIEDRHAKEIERIRALKEIWSRHQEDAGKIIRSICQKHTIQYIDRAPFKGDPDNTIMICEEYIVFDAKSPGSDDLSNFPIYLKDQAEKAKKYAQQDAVKSDVFFVVPSNTLDYLSTFVYRHGDHNVYIISIDALEPIILELKKIEEYEFAEQLSPDDRENICRVLGKFAHLSKRRIQVDIYFARQFIELAYKCETDLPKDILDKVIEFEKAEKLNPPQEKRVKAIPIADLEKESKSIRQEAEGRGIVIEYDNISNSLNELPLYKKLEE